MSAPTREQVRARVMMDLGYCFFCEDGICTGDGNKQAAHALADEIVRLRTLADDDAAVERACDAEDLHVASAGIDGQFGRTQEDRMRAALRAALGGAP